ncbi:MAG: M23 family metallopeptidase [Candidatus Marinimicrobia bacterium]|jgi:hypothetical protein|nr:M23 family metallopeptidase [Candidatus Neomarinimicrobiota bacterium]MDP6261205.1 M23 family metallopeptidase [Candidatus Neomarinimicrobiota bacterium]MDP7127211.1 M23 family metallopeptidase [Candidatus Neomarinimicrobiota bacterium]MDP7474730.1 M23 family metallopeptidase [Candidatus Neomarinimicrobiota bacterium]MDP7526147.1 M23 family metallopeptidase [Candidatus Neomarinimicrobiota bacterium]|tara:strand:- start:1297 stop:2103 length:807 start_codon:yes stop_codon:yes gene_type:complete
MSPSKFTVILIPDSDDRNRQFSVRYVWLWSLVLLVVLIIIGVIGFGIYSVPKLKDYQAMQEKYDKTVTERVTVMNLMDDLQRMKYMDRQIRKSLGTDLALIQKTTDTEEMSQNIHLNNSENLPISYMENVPSQIPVEGFVTQRMNTSAFSLDQNHYGIDIAAVEGKPVLASASGFVVFSDWTYDLGNVVILYHGDGYFTHYGHHQNNIKKQRDFVKRGDVVALVGSTGITTGPHLHFEIWKEGKVLDPLEFFPGYTKTDVSPQYHEQN